MKRLNFSPRPASEDDLSQVVKIESYSNAPPWGVDAFRAELDKKHSQFWVITDDETDEKVFAYIVFSFLAEQAHIQTLAVSRDSRRSGYAKYLLRRVISYVNRNSGKSIVLEVRKGNVPAIQLYQSLGFIILHLKPEFYPDGEDGYSMLYKTEKNRLTGDAEEDFENDGADDHIRH